MNDIGNLNFVRSLNAASAIVWGSSSCHWSAALQLVMRMSRRQWFTRMCSTKAAARCAVRLRED